MPPPKDLQYHCVLIADPNHPEYQKAVILLEEHHLDFQVQPLPNTPGQVQLHTHLGTFVNLPGIENFINCYLGTY